MRTFLQTVLDFDAKCALLGTIRTQQVDAAEREFYSLKRHLQQYARINQDVQLMVWLDAIQSEFDGDRKDLNQKLSDVEDAEMAIRLAQTYEEMEAKLQHAEKLAELAAQKMHLHVDFIQELSARLKAKIAEAEPPPVTDR
jgi:phosphoglycerate-specific signal transduction histidine kinase